MYIIILILPFLSEETFGALLIGSSFQSEASSSLRFHPYAERDDYLEYDYHFQMVCCFGESDNICPIYTNQRRVDDCTHPYPGPFGKLFYKSSIVREVQTTKMHYSTCRQKIYIYSCSNVT